MKIDPGNKLFSGYLYSVLVILFFSFLAIVLEKILLPKTGVLLILQLALVIISITNSRLTTTLSSLVCALVFNYFFTAPLYSLHMTEAEDIINTLIFLIIAVITSEFSIRYRKQSEALRNAELRSNILLSVSHDLRTPLAGIIGAMSTLKEYQDRISEQEKAGLIDSTLQESHRLHHYIENLLQATRLHHGQVKLKPKRQPLRPIIERVEQRLDNRRLLINLADDLPLICVQDSLLEQALYNIADNALKYSPVDKLVCLNSTCSADAVEIRITDLGPGIPADQQERIFDLFYSTREGDKGYGGSGIGLTVARGIIEAHGGSLSTEEPPDTSSETDTGQPGRGCTMLIRLPLTKGDASE